MQNLHELLKIHKEKRELICLVGGGGKTSVMFRLAGELAAKGMRVLVTTTTAIYYPDKHQYDRILFTGKGMSDVSDIEGKTGITALGRSVSAEGKLLGVDPGFLDSLFEKRLFDCIIVEGDGSKGRPIKAPAAHEPVIPIHSTKVLGIIGMDSMGKPVSEAFVHRPELFCSITGCVEGDTIDAELVSRLVMHEEGLFKGAPDKAEKYLVLNKADREAEKKSALAIAEKLAEKGCGLNGIITSSIRKSDFNNTIRQVSGIILASGLSRRMGANKLLLPLGGIPVIERIIAEAVQSRLEEVILVCAGDEIAEVGRRYGIEIVHNASPQEGQSRSVRLGTAAAAEYADGLMFLVGDQPLITADIIDQLVDRFRKADCGAVVSYYKGRRGNPVVFSTRSRDELMGLQGDYGGRVLLEKMEDGIEAVEFDDEKPGIDIDTAEAYEKLLGHIGKHE
ncbi:MAG TPA: selenium cofactor biosynthesis protein YqeC [Negativicutes bacterium]|nr:selenium cofactor biosynthesis protein YqeC [Negativicutes bacterium]